MKININNTPALTSSNMETHEFGMELSAKTFKIFTSSIYKYKIRAIVREIISNASDGLTAKLRRDGMLGDKLIDVTLPTTISPNFVVRDYGVSMTDEFVKSVYCTYFASTKNESNEEIGGLGLGCKSPMCYVNTFTVTTFLNNIKTIFSVFMMDSGRPNIATIGKFITDEPNGVEVNVPVQSKDISEFEEEYRRVIPFFEFQPTLIGKQLNDYNAISFDENGFAFAVPTLYRTGLYAVMGGVVYPIPCELYEDTIFKHHASVRPTFVKFDIGELDFQPSREELSLDEQTIANIKAKLKEIQNKKYHEVVAHELESAKSYRDFYTRLEKKFKLKNAEIDFEDRFWKWVSQNYKNETINGITLEDHHTRSYRSIMTDFSKSWGVKMIQMNKNDNRLSELTFRKTRYNWTPFVPSRLTDMNSCLYQSPNMIMCDLSAEHKNDRTKIIRGLHHLGLVDLINRRSLYFSHTSDLPDAIMSRFEDNDGIKLIRLSEWRERALDAEETYRKNEKLKNKAESKPKVYSGVWMLKIHNGVISRMKQKPCDVKNFNGFFVDIKHEDLLVRHRDLLLSSKFQKVFKDADIWILPKSCLTAARKNENLAELTDDFLKKRIVKISRYFYDVSKIDITSRYINTERKVFRTEHRYVLPYLEKFAPYIYNSENNNYVDLNQTIMTQLITWFDDSDKCPLLSESHELCLQYEQKVRELNDLLEECRTEFQNEHPVLYYWLIHNISSIEKITPNVEKEIKKLLEL